ncbi:hypothetical protein OUZ56_017157 [Daphnia magna]|uniref:Uncharacterized protein n=1 Tax=Daphnia magna TaxID=35525 RepID=A0ABR0ASB0_9CRUS|nr:hypothetical protein OUZ56_017157 [Daphnia magna]
MKYEKKDWLQQDNPTSEEINTPEWAVICEYYDSGYLGFLERNRPKLEFSEIYVSLQKGKPCVNCFAISKQFGKLGSHNNDSLEGLED